MSSCPNCGKPVPANEWHAYGRHEDCAFPSDECVGFTMPSVMRSRELGRERKGQHVSETDRRSGSPAT